MAFRRKLAPRKSQKVWQRGNKTHVKNLQTSNPMRGGIRL